MSSQKRVERAPVVQILPYTTQVPFDKLVSIVEHTLVDNDVLTPLLMGDTSAPVPSYGAIYRLIGDGTHAPVFAPIFKKAASSGDYDSGPQILNLIIFLFDGFDYWYTITQPVAVPLPPT